MSTTCCDEGDETTRKTGRPNGCCDTSDGKVVVYGGTDYIEGSYIETSICCGYSVDELIDNGTFSEAFRDMLTGNNYAALIAHNNAAFKAETDLVGSPSGCCDITQNILQKGERTFVNMSKCCSLDSAPGTTSDGKPTCDMVGSGSGSGANMASIQQQINPSQVLESYGLFAE